MLLLNTQISNKEPKRRENIEILGCYFCVDVSPSKSVNTLENSRDSRKCYRL